MSQKIKKRRAPIKILFVNGPGSPNKGAVAIVRSAKEALEKHIPQSQFGVLLTPTQANPNYTAPGAEIVRIASRRQAIFVTFECILWRMSRGLFRRDLLNLEKKLPLFQYDLFVDVSGDCFNDDWGIRHLLFYLSSLLDGLILKKSLVFYGESIGPFTTLIGKYLARYMLRRAKLIMVREEISRDILQKLGIRAILTGEPAFALESLLNAEMEKQISDFRGTGKLVGISLAQQAILISSRQSNSKKQKNLNSYIDTMTQTVNYLIEEKGAKVVLVPHVCGPGIADDRIIQSKVLAKIKNKEKVLNITEDYEAEELKGIIGRCWMFIGTRMHANVAALSSGVPTIAIRCEHKAQGIMRQAGLERYVVDIYAMNFGEMVSKIDEIWAKREQISQELQNRMKVVKKQALSNAVLVKELLDSRAV